MIPVYGSDKETKDFFKTIPSGPETDPYSKGGRLDVDRSKRYEKFGKALEAASNYKKKKEAENQVDAAMGKNNDDEKNTQGFKIAPDATVVEGYRDKGFTVQAPKGGGILGTVGAAVTPFFPITGQVIGGVGGVTGF